MRWDKLARLPASDIRKLQSDRLRKFARHELMFSPHYRELFKAAKLDVADIRTTDDLQRIPFSSKADIAPTEEDRTRPRGFILQPDEHLIKKYASKGKLVKLLAEKLMGRDVKRRLEWEYKPIHVHFTTGRTALPTPFTYSARDLEFLKDSGERMLSVINVTRDLTAVNGFPYAPHLAFWLAFFALTQIGMTSVQTGGGKIMGTQKILDTIERGKSNLLIFIPGYCYHLLREAVKQKRDFSNVKYVVFGGERASPGLREKVKAMLRELGAPDPKVFVTYAFTEGKTAWIQCSEDQGYHLYPDLEFFEVIDKGGKRVRDGEPGELVYTALGWRGSVAVRYRTGDMTQGIDWSPCPNCGRTVPRIRPDIQRSSEIKEFQLTKVKGELINLNVFYPLLSGMPEIEEWQVEIRKKGNDPFGLDEVFVHVAAKAGVPFNRVAAKVKEAIRNEALLNVEVKPAELPALLEKLGMETELKEKRIVDNRPKG